MSLVIGNVCCAVINVHRNEVDGTIGTESKELEQPLVYLSLIITRACRSKNLPLFRLP
jgi:hypothetical protein